MKTLKQGKSFILWLPVSAEGEGNYVERGIATHHG